MRRIQFIEIHDQPWLPSFLRDDITDALQFGLSFFKAYSPVIPLLQQALHSTRSKSIVDLCSGGGGPWLDLSKDLQRDGMALPIYLTDKYPNIGAFENFQSASNGRIRFFPKPVDAMKVPCELDGFRTMFTSLHHFTPDEVRAILQDAADAGRGIAVFEISKRSLWTIGLMLPWALTPFVLAPFMRPFRWSRLLWTYLIPAIPLVFLFDAVVSCLRSYRPEELREIIEKVTGAEYQWEAGERSGGSGKLATTYLVGCPKACVLSAKLPEREMAGAPNA
jgi:hypothetical protein